jgi:Ig-like domain from next to BRCA1 gene
MDHIFALLMLPLKCTLRAHSHKEALSKGENMIQRNYRMFSFFITAALVLACAAPALVPASAPVPTVDPNSINTVIAQTAGAAATQTARMLPPTLTPTVTLLPTNTITETPTPTFIFILATPTVPSETPPPQSSDAKFACQVTSQTPANNSGITKGADFETRWQVTNIGKDTWDSDNADYRYVSGDKLHKAAIYDLNSSVSPGGKTEIVVAMKAPPDPGTYTTTWKITSGKTAFCTMTLTIIVN